MVGCRNVMRRDAARNPVAIRLAHRRSVYLRFLDGRACDKAESASDFVLADDRPPRNASEASRATRREVCLLFFATSITSFVSAA